MSGREKQQLSIIIGLFVIALSSLLALYRLPVSGAVELLTKIAFAILVAAVIRSLELIFDLMKGQNPSASFEKLGMRSVSRRLSSETLGARLAGAHTIRVLKTWFPETGIIQDGLDSAIRRQGAKVDLLLAHPDSKMLAVRSEGAGASPGHGKHHVETALGSLAKSAHAAGDDRVQVGLYDSWPGSPVIWYDDKILLGFYLRGHPSPEWPWIEVEPNSELAAILEGQYESLRSQENTIHLSSLDKIEKWLEERKRAVSLAATDHPPGPT